MKKTFTPLVTGVLLVAGTFATQAAIYDIDLSPVGGTALNLGPAPTHYFGDHAVGMAAPNEGHMPPSPATGDEIGPGVTYDTVTKMLTFDIGYGSGHGFVDLVGTFSGVHLHGPGPVAFPAPNLSAGVVHPLGGFHAPITPFSGTIIGAVPLTAVEEMMLFDNELYINIHSAFSPGGEIRGQLIAVPEPTAAMLLLPGALAIQFIRRRFC